MILTWTEFSGILCGFFASEVNNVSISKCTYSLTICLFLDLNFTRRDAFDAKQSELLGQVNSLRRKLAQKDHRIPHPSSLPT